MQLVVYVICKCMVILAFSLCQRAAELLHAKWSMNSKEALVLLMCYFQIQVLLILRLVQWQEQHQRKYVLCLFFRRSKRCWVVVRDWPKRTDWPKQFPVKEIQLTSSELPTQDGRRGWPTPRWENLIMEFILSFLLSSFLNIWLFVYCRVHTCAYM